MEFNPKKTPVGSVVYFLRQKNGWRSPEKEVWFGTVVEHYIREVAIQLYEPFDTRTINGIPVKEFKTPTAYKKLPKGWSWDTKLFEIGNYVPDELKEFMSLRHNDIIASPENILAAIKAGALVKVDDNDHAVFSTTIDKSHGFSIVRNYSEFSYNPNTISLPWGQLYETYEDAKRELDTINAEFIRQSELSDLDWSIEQIEITLDTWADIYNIPQEKKDEVRKRLLALDRLEDVVTKISDHGVQWKYEKEKRWKLIE